MRVLCIGTVDSSITEYLSQQAMTVEDHALRYQRKRHKQWFNPSHYDACILSFHHMTLIQAQSLARKCVRYGLPVIGIYNLTQDEIRRRVTWDDIEASLLECGLLALFLWPGNPRSIAATLRNIEYHYSKLGENKIFTLAYGNYGRSMLTVNRLLKRCQINNGPIISFLDNPGDWGIFETLALQPRTIVTPDTLKKAVRKSGGFQGLITQVHIANGVSRIRKKLGDHGRDQDGLIRNYPRGGYMLEAWLAESLPLKSVTATAA